MIALSMGQVTVSLLSLRRGQIRVRVRVSVRVKVRVRVGVLQQVDQLAVDASELLWVHDLPAARHLEDLPEEVAVVAVRAALERRLVRGRDRGDGSHGTPT